MDFSLPSSLGDNSRRRSSGASFPDGGGDTRSLDDELLDLDALLQTTATTTTELKGSHHSDTKQAVTPAHTKSNSSSSSHLVITVGQSTRSQGSWFAAAAQNVAPDKRGRATAAVPSGNTGTNKHHTQQQPQQQQPQQPQHHAKRQSHCACAAVVSILSWLSTTFIGVMPWTQTVFVERKRRLWAQAAQHARSQALLPLKHTHGQQYRLQTEEQPAKAHQARRRSKSKPVYRCTWCCTPVWSRRCARFGICAGACLWLRLRLLTAADTVINGALRGIGQVMFANSPVAGLVIMLALCIATGWHYTLLGTVGKAAVHSTLARLCCSHHHHNDNDNLYPNNHRSAGWHLTSNSPGTGTPSSRQRLVRL